jgi:hypothetical protein
MITNHRRKGGEAIRNNTAWKDKELTKWDLQSRGEYNIGDVFAAKAERKAGGSFSL